MVNGARRYEVLSVLGQGGFGTVYRARYVGEGGFTKDVALKVLKPEMAAMNDVASRLRDEARVLGHLHHPAIVAVDRLVQLGGRWTVVMEYVEGVDLSKLLKAGPLPAGVALEIVAEVAGVLHAAWCQEVNGRPLHLLHRDLKPSNIRITRFGKIKVLDFGIARAEFDAREAETRSLRFGTPEYMAPERLDYAPDGPAGDIYALGAILFEVVTGKRLGRTSADAGRHMHTLSRAEALMSQVPDLPAEVRNLTLSMLAWSPAERPDATASELVALSLVRLVGGEPLRTWAGDMIPPLLEAMKAEPVVAEGEFTGSSLLEQAPESDETTPLTVGQPAPASHPPRPSDPVEALASEARPALEPPRDVAAPPAREAKPSRGPARAFLGLGLLVLIGIPGILGVWDRGSSEHTNGTFSAPQPPPKAPEVTPVAPPDPVTDGSDPGQGGGADKVHGPFGGAPDLRGGIDPRAPRQVTPPPPPTSMGRVVLEREGAVDVRLIPENGTPLGFFSKSETPVDPGRYSVEYCFPNSSEGTCAMIRDKNGVTQVIDIAKDGMVKIVCRMSFSNCSASIVQ